ncbi:MAG: M28 family peptidase, partial [Peptococcaceae bacterium]|nr:M28 family peptidase [Peptococcaceae bacterium]
MKKFLSILVIFTLIFTSAAPMTFAKNQFQAYEEGNLIEYMTYLVYECGQSFRGTPNEKKAADYCYDVLAGFGYETEMYFPSLGNGNAVAIFEMSEGPDILGNASPNSAAVEGANGKLIDLGTYGDDWAFSVPEGTEGNIVGAVRFTAAPTAAMINAIVAAATEDESVTLTGLMTTNISTATTMYGAPASLTGTDVPCLGVAYSNMCRALQLPDYGLTKYLDGTPAPGNYVLSSSRATYTNTYTVVAKKPPTSGQTDLIIVFSGHFDTVLNSPGCNDDKSAIATILEMGRRFKDVDTGNVELWFCPAGSEEGNGYAGAAYVANTLLVGEEKAKAIDLNADMIAPGLNATYRGQKLDAISMDYSNTNQNNLVLNLPAYLVVDKAADIDWNTDVTNVTNVRIYGYGSSSHTPFHNAGIDAASMIFVQDSADDIEDGLSGYHTGNDTMSIDYSIERHVLTTKLMENAVWRAINDKVTKVAKFDVVVKGDNADVTLTNAGDIFNTWYQVDARFTGKD